MICHMTYDDFYRINDILYLCVYFICRKSYMFVYTRIHILSVISFIDTVINLPSIKYNKSYT